MKDESTVVSFARDDEPDSDPREDGVPRTDDVVPDEADRQAEVQAAAAKHTGSKPVPTAAKWAMGAFAVLAAAVFAWTITNFMRSDEPQPWQVADTELKGAIESQFEQIKGELTTAVQSSAAATENRYTAALEEAKSVMGDQTAALTARVGSLEQSLAAFNEGIAQQGRQIAEIRNLLETQPTDVALIRREIGLAVQKYDRKWRELSEDVAGYAPAAAPVNTVKAAQLPFQIVSMDLWDGRPQLAVRDNDTWRFLRVGDHLRGWMVASADYGAGTVGLRNANSQLFAMALPKGGGAIAQAANRPKPTSASGLPNLTVLTEPREATVKVMNIVPKYRDEMALRPGAYDILVQHAGYQTYRRWIRLGGRDRVLHVALMR